MHPVYNANMKPAFEMQFPAQYKINVFFLALDWILRVGFHTIVIDGFGYNWQVMHPKKNIESTDEQYNSLRAAH